MVFSRKRSGPQKVILCDKNSIMLKGLTTLFEETGDFKVEKVLFSGEEFLKAVKKCESHLAVIGWEFRDCSGREILEKMQDMNNRIRVLVYSARQVSYTAMMLGAAGYHSKTDDPDVLPDLLKTIAVGKLCFPYLNQNKDQGMGSLTDREFQMLELVTTGMNNRAIAKTMYISENTVKFHLKNLYLKLNVKNRTEAASIFREKIY